MIRWVLLAVALLVPLGLSLISPLLAWRSPLYIIAGFAGVIGLGVLLLQPLLAGGYLLNSAAARRVHWFLGIGLLVAVLVHVGGLWITSPPDVVDALLFASPTPFSAWGVIAMWAVFLVASLLVLRQQVRIAPKAWRVVHRVLAAIIALGTVIHALLIEGTMEPVSKAILCALVLLATAPVVLRFRPFGR